MNTILVITRLTFREAIRRRVVIAALVLGVIFLIVFGLGFYFINAEYEKDIALHGPSIARFRDEVHNFLILAGMYVVNFLGIATAALITADSLAGEISSGTIQAVVTKPIRRSEVVMGKWLGNALLLLLYMLMMAGGVVACGWGLVGYLPPNWFTGLALVYANSLLIMSLTLAFSSSFTTLATGGAVFGSYGIAFIGGWVERIGSVIHNQTAMDIGIFSSLLLPSEALFNKASNLMTSPLASMVNATPFSSASEPSTLMLVYSAVYLLLMMGIAVRNFSRRDL